MLSSSGHGGIQSGFSMPGGVLANSNTSSESVESAQAAFAKNPYAYSDATPAGEEDTTVCGLEIKSGGTAVKVSGLEGGLIGVSCGEPDDMKICSYWDDESSSWSIRGVINDGGICMSSHLTDFSGMAENSVPEMNAVDPIGDAALLSKLDASNMGPALILAGLHAVYWLSVTYGYFKDRKERLAWRSELRAERKKQKLAIKIAAQKKKAARRAVTEGNPLQLLNAKDGVTNSEDNGENKGNKPSGSKWGVVRDKVVDTPVEKQESSASAAWSVVFQQFGAAEHSQNVADTFKDEMKEGHTLLSIWYVQPEDPFTRPQRLTVLMCAILGNLVLSAIFFGKEPEEADQQMVVGIICSLIMFPVEKVFVAMFAQNKPDKKASDEALARHEQRKLLRIQRKYSDVHKRRGRRRGRNKKSTAKAKPVP